MQNLKGKKLLVLGGAFQHCKLIEAAKELGVITYVTDYLPLSEAPGKQMADKYFMYNITEYDAIAEMCRSEKIDGVIATSLDACQLPYQRICAMLGLPCFGTAEQYKLLTDKTAFKEQCRKSGVDVIDEYTEADFSDRAVCEKRVKFPIFIKPCDSRGSRGQSVCHNYDEAKSAIEFAKSESATGKIVIEKYMGKNDDFSMTLIVINGKVYPFRTVDRILGPAKDGLDKLAVGATMPSKYTDLYFNNVHKKIEKFAKDIGLQNAPFFMQGFIDGDTVRFYDPGLRLPGGEYERMFKSVFKKDVFYPLIEYALTGKVSEDSVTMNLQDVLLDGKIAAQVLPALHKGTISEIKGMEEIRNHPKVVSAFPRYSVGDTVQETHNVNQRFCEIDIVCDNKDELQSTVRWVYDTLNVLDENGRNMLV